ncbi:putative NADH-dependent oxidoreductase [Caenibius tardaugens NBRC 16725]|uniref:Putative NADH-dependent oxidoreductase n=1 Tax=Caenibius tardaugens NBRC 16725 TaxID=1219035 RepID=U3A728_9SPHN|nr:FAD-dependent oxidoreductase [Caenibius tardaugens]AZI35370.1 FAD-binding protein [Caenibius tardaugens NBRC 16725]GAD50548.1 putative NADH-dependent oxidoreductase [Caenibius tardaugens NBRC 16725]
MAKHYSHLLSVGRIGAMELRNRLLLTAMGTGYAEEDGSCGERILEFNRSIAQGGTALVTMGVVGVGWPLGNNMPRQPAISQDRFIPGIRKVAEAVHAEGAKFALQLHFGGLIANAAARQPVWCPSVPQASAGDSNTVFLPEELEAGGFADLPPLDYHEMTQADIDAVIQMFADGARRAVEAGADGLEIHGGHGYLFSSFLSPITNRRTDAYGGVLENRARLLVDTVRAIRTAVGPDIAVWTKIDAIEYDRPGGITLEDAIATARMAEAAGADAITTTAYHDPRVATMHSGSHTPQVPALNADKAAAIKAAVNIPVILSGRIEPDVGDRAIAAGEADFIAMGRKLLADPALPNKLAAGDEKDVLPCIYCYTCISAIYTRETARCAVNPRTGFESEIWLPPVQAPRNVLVIGGGPAGMEAARRLDERGHRVTLMEQGDRLGGTLQFASIAYAPNERILDWLRRGIDASKVTVQLNTVADSDMIKALAPDAVIVATGARRDIPPMPGADMKHVLGGDDLRQLVLGGNMDDLRGKVSLTTRLAAKAGALTGLTRDPAFIREATKTWLPLGKHIVIIGGDLVGLELAEFLAERGRSVTVIDESEHFGRGLAIVRRWRVFDELRKLDVALYPHHTEIEIAASAVTARDQSGERIILKADNVIVAKGARGDLALADMLEQAGLNVHAIGDCTGVGYIEGAMRSAARTAKLI